MRLALSGSLALLLASCADGGASFDYPMDDVLRMNHVQALGTHNSYHQDPHVGVDAWAYSHLPLDRQLEEQGVRQLELDVYYYDQGGPPRFEVFHAPIDDRSSCRLLLDCLRRVKSWSDGHRAHHPIVILIESKDPDGAVPLDAYLELLENDVLSVFSRDRLVTPDLVRGDAATLREAIVGPGWPTLGEVRGRVMFVLMSSGYAERYTRGDLRGRAMFVASGTSEPWASVLLIDDALADQAAIRDAVAQGFLVRTRADIDGVEARAGDRTRLDAALQSGAQMVSTDFPSPYPATGYLAAIPGGTPSGCDPLVAPAGCTPAAVEDPRWLH